MTMKQESLLKFIRHVLGDESGISAEAWDALNLYADHIEAKDRNELEFHLELQKCMRQVKLAFGRFFGEEA